MGSTKGDYDCYLQSPHRLFLQLCSPNLVSKYLRLQHLQASSHPERRPTHRYRLPNDGLCRSTADGGRGPHGWGTPGHAMCPVPSHLPPAAPPLLSYSHCGLRPQENEVNTPTSILCTSRELHMRRRSECRRCRCSGSHQPHSSGGIYQGQRYQQISRHACPNHQRVEGRTIEEDQAHPVSAEVRFLSRT